MDALVIADGRRFALAAQALCVVGVGLAAYAAVEPARLAALRLSEPTAVLEYGEGFMLPGAELVRERGLSALYPASWDVPPLQVSPYPPVMYVLWALLAEALGRGADYLPGRLIAAAGFALGVALVYAIPRRLGVDRWLAAASALTLPLTGILARWLAVGRVDVPGVALSLLGVLCVLQLSGRAAVILATLCFAAALGFKQSLVAAPVAAFLYLLTVGRAREALGLALGLGGVGIATVALLQWFTDGGFALGIVFAQRMGIQWSEGFLAMFEKAVGLGLLLPALPLALALPLLLLGWRGPERLVTLYFAISWALSLATVGKVGANTNHMLEPLFATFVAAPVGASLLARRIAGSEANGRARMRWAAPLRALVVVALACTALFMSGRIAVGRETQASIFSRMPKRLRLDLPERGFVMMNPGLLPLLGIPATRLYWNEPYAVSVHAALGGFRSETVLEDLQDGTISALVENQPLEVQPVSRPRFVGDFERGWGPWSIRPWLETARREFRRVEIRPPYHVYHRAP